MRIQTSAMVKASVEPLTANAQVFYGEDALTGAANIPQWVCQLLNLPASSVSQVCVYMSHDGRCSYEYDNLIEYFAYHAVDPDQPYHVVESAEATNPKSNVRRVTGRLSSLFYNSCEPMDAPTHDESCHSESNYVSDEEEHSEQAWPHRSVFKFGLGSARVQVDGKDVCVLHKSKGTPVRSGVGAAVYRVLYLFADSTETLHALADAALHWDFLRSLGERTRAGKYRLYTLTVQHGMAHWNDEGSKASRALESVILPDGMLDKIVEDFVEFSAPDTKDWYIAHGLPHRRSYLFHGPPGVGKTSTIRALAGALKRSACFLSLGNANIGNAQLQQALRNIPKKAMLVIEDIDALFDKERVSKNTSLLTFSGLLNSLDGLVSAEGILTVMTTNHLDRLDVALIRAGRVDRKFEFCPPTHEQIMGLFRSFYCDAPEELVREFADAVCKREEADAKSIATLQEHFIFTRRKTARESVDSLDAFFTEFYPEMKRKQISQAVERARKNKQVVNADVPNSEDEDADEDEGEMTGGE